LIFHTGRFLKDFKVKGTHTISVRASSELDGENSAHFNFWINDSLAADFKADRRRRKYSITWKGALSDIDSVMIQFDNDSMGDFGDRNLFVRDILFDKDVKVPFLNNSVYDISALDNKKRIVNDMHSNAEMTAKRLISLGVDPNIVIAVPGNKARINRTLTSALAIRDWLRENPVKITGINVVSAGTHSRRTWMTFSRVLPVSVGIISLPDRKIRYSGDIRIIKTLRETIAFIYYWIILIPYCS
ncbi:MAG TPA: carbohydrate-binding domain-containing protein, partial [Bacteroidales bacterium]|nr:carbohydrate-binding domain-containing protein [Bacteroidales bacterium]